MNVTTQVRRTSTASALAMAALMVAACTAEEESPESPESKDEGSIELTVTPNTVAFSETGSAEYTAEWKADANGDDGTCEFVLSVTDSANQVIHSVPVTGCESSMAMTLVNGTNDTEPGEYIVELERDGERAEAAFTLEK